jgi:hypothetical protein
VHWDKEERQRREEGEEDIPSVLGRPQTAKRARNQSRSGRAAFGKNQAKNHTYEKKRERESW